MFREMASQWREHKLYWEAMRNGNFTALRDFIIAMPPLQRHSGSPIFAAAYYGHNHLCQWMFRSEECRHLRSGANPLTPICTAVWSALFGAAVVGFNTLNSARGTTVSPYAVGKECLQTALDIAAYAFEIGHCTRLELKQNIFHDTGWYLNRNASSPALNKLNCSMQDSFGFKTTDYRLFPHMVTAVCEFVEAIETETRGEKRGDCNPDADLEDTVSFVGNIINAPHVSTDGTHTRFMNHLTSRFQFFNKAAVKFSQTLDKHWRYTASMQNWATVPTLMNLEWIAPSPDLPLTNHISNMTLCLNNLCFLMEWYLYWENVKRDPLIRKWIINYSARFRNLRFPQRIDFSKTLPENSFTQKATTMYELLTKIRDCELVDGVTENLKYSSFFHDVNFELLAHLPRVLDIFSSDRRLPRKKQIEIAAMYYEWKIYKFISSPQSERDGSHLVLVHDLKNLYSATDGHSALRLMILYNVLRREFPADIPHFVNTYTPEMSHPAINLLVWTAPTWAEGCIRERHFRVRTGMDRAKFARSYKYMRNQLMLKKILKGQRLEALTKRPLPERIAFSIIAFL